MVTGSIYVGPGAPKILADRTEDIYNGNGYDLADSLKEFGKDLQYSPVSNVFASIYFDKNRSGVININSIIVTNNSDSRVFVDRIIFHSQNASYSPNPSTIRPQINSDKFMTIDSSHTKRMFLTPSGNPLNPTNQFGPRFVQNVTVYVVFRFVPAPGSSVVTFKLIP
jgi:hypothetical protein